MKAFFIFFLGGCLLSFSQEGPQPFLEDVVAINKKYDSIWDTSRETIVFTGSSSIRLWKDLEQRFPGHQILNTGFGGSQTQDLLSYLDELVLQYHPSKIFIYEGDNDLFDKKRPKEILEVYENIYDSISARSEAEVILISAKPSIARWRLRRRYRRLNKKLMQWSLEYDRLTFIDVWHPMLNGRKLNKTLFVEDGLHMNDSGYELWYEAIEPYVSD